MFELKAQGEEKGEDAFDTCLALVHQLKVSGSILEIDGDGAVLTYRFGSLSHVSSPWKSRWVLMRHGEGNVLKYQAYGERLGTSPLNPVECGTADQVN